VREAYSPGLRAPSPLRVAYTDFRRPVYLNDLNAEQGLMQQKKRSYSDELKSEAVKMVNEQGLSQEEAGRRVRCQSHSLATTV
jgi:hypothetical protein